MEDQSASLPGMREVGGRYCYTLLEASVRVQHSKAVLRFTINLSGPRAARHSNWTIAPASPARLATD